MNLCKAKKLDKRVMGRKEVKKFMGKIKENGLWHEQGDTWERWDKFYSWKDQGDGRERKKKLKKGDGGSTQRKDSWKRPYETS